MKKTIFVLSAVMFIFTSSIFKPVTVCAALNACPPHTYSATYSGLNSEPAGSPYYEKDGMILTCDLTAVYQGSYPRCVSCGFIDYDSPYSETLLFYRHSAQH